MKQILFEVIVHCSYWTLFCLPHGRKEDVFYCSHLYHSFDYLGGDWGWGNVAVVADEVSLLLNSEVGGLILQCGI